MNTQEPDYKRLFFAVFLAAVVLILWQAKVEWPRRQALAQYNVAQTHKVEEVKAVQAAQAPAQGGDAEENPMLTRDQRLSASPRVAIVSDKLHGSIALEGARFDDIKLAKYRETLDKDSPEVTLFSPAGDAQAYFAQIGWVASDNATKVPDQHTKWQADKKTLGPDETVHLRWDNGAGVTFVLAVSLDKDYMFSIGQSVENHGGNAVSVVPYAYINRTYEEPKQHYAIMHEGPLGVMQGTLTEIGYKDLREKGPQSFDDATGWLGITDKYWLAALVPLGEHYKVTFSHYTKGTQERYQADYLGSAITAKPGDTAQASIRLFAGAKELRVLDRYTTGDAEHPPIPLFDRAVDFGLAIMMLTIVVKLCMYPLANKAFHATSQMRELQPQMVKLRERHKDDQLALNKEMMALYKREKVNPASGCFPVLIQMPVFFALYKVLFVTIEMRHAPFIGWIKDLSVLDPSNIFTLFGLIPWEPPLFMHLGVLPMLMCATMVIQMRQQPKPADPTQAKVMTFMPYFMLIIFSKMPAGLVLYWTWSNMISIGQQLVISKRHAAKKERRKAKEVAA